MRQQVDRDLIVMFDDEAAAFEHLAGQPMPHLERREMIIHTSEERYVVKEGKV